ncbi:hypothetical protein CEUSTIGMA_g9802.t1, partial [Chlamydomonas eustigma]
YKQCMVLPHPHPPMYKQCLLLPHPHPLVYKQFMVLPHPHPQVYKQCLLLLTVQVLLHLQSCCLLVHCLLLRAAAAARIIVCINYINYDHGIGVNPDIDGGDQKKHLRLESMKAWQDSGVLGSTKDRMLIVLGTDHFSLRSTHPILCTPKHP